MNEFTEPAPSPDDVWRLFRETDRQQKETDRQLRETDQQLKKYAEEAEQRFREAERRFQETERFFKERDREMARRFKETDQKIGKLTSRLGEFVEAFVAPSLIQIFQARGIAVNGLSRDISRRNPQLNLATQIDLFAINGDTCILIEVKSKLSIDDVNEHLERMEKFKRLFPEYADKQAFGAVAAMVIPEAVAKYAYHKGFFVLAQQGETVAILNDENFKPVAW